MERRKFIWYAALTGVGWPLTGTSLSSCGNENNHSLPYKHLLEELLVAWCDGLIKRQIYDPTNTKIHGVLNCPACEHVHGRIMDAVYPMFYLAKKTGDQKYLDAGIALFEWGANVTRADGAWTNDLDPKSWDGTTVFGAIALGETLHYHGDLLGEGRRARWTDRLAAAAAFVYQRFPSIGNANINYGATTIYALNLFGRLLNKKEYILRSGEMADQIKSYFTHPNTFLFGEAQGDRTRRSSKGLRGIDLGYNLEESMNSLVLYALEVDDKDLLQLLERSLTTHLNFILPDGGLDNGFGNRMFKWTYWGSRTSDGMQQAFSMMANRNPAFGTAAFKNAMLLKRCTNDGLLHGGPHYVSHGIKPCIHHTFSHVKPLAAMLENWDQLPPIKESAPLPRELMDGLQYYAELDTTIFGKGDWRGTITAYDGEYDLSTDCRQATGGALSLLFHCKVGLLCTASMAVYKMKEANNQQPAPGKDIALTPRIETYLNQTWYTNLFDLAATFTSTEQDNKVKVTASVQLKDESRKLAKGTATDFTITYSCTGEEVEIVASTDQTIQQVTEFVIPLVSRSGEPVVQLSDKVFTIEKPEGRVALSANVPLRVMSTAKKRTFNMVPGVEAIPFAARFPEEGGPIRLTLKIE